jgi:hypothetical protein
MRCFVNQVEIELRAEIAHHDQQARYASNRLIKATHLRCAAKHRASLRLIQLREQTRAGNVQADLFDGERP